MPPVALVGAEQPGIFERHLPDVDDVGVERSVSIAGRHVDERSDRILGVEERHEVDRVRIGRERLVAPVERTAPIDDLVHLAVRLAEHFLQHQVVIDRRHAPDHGFDGAALGGTLRELIGCRCLCESRLRDHCGKCDGRDHELLHLSLPTFRTKRLPSSPASCRRVSSLSLWPHPALSTLPGYSGLTRYDDLGLVLCLICLRMLLSSGRLSASMGGRAGRADRVELLGQAHIAAAPCTRSQSSPAALIHSPRADAMIS